MIKTDKIKKTLELNYNLKTNNYDYFPETNKELRELIDKIIYKYGICADLNNVRVSYINNFEDVFSGKVQFNGDVSEWDVSNGLDFRFMFFICRNFNSNVSMWDISNGKYFEYMFSSCDDFNSNLSKWNVSNGKYFFHMFEECYNFNSDLSNWDVSNGTDFDYMFYECKSFNADLSNWKVSNAKSWKSFADSSLLEKYPERIPEKFRNDCFK
jgi:surface protein